MAYGTPTDPVAGTVITVAYAVTNLLDPIRQLRANTGAADPPAVNRVAISTGIGGPTSWQQVPTDAILNAAVTDVKLALQKVNAATPNVSTFASLIAANRSGFYEVVTASDGPVAGQSYYAINVVEFNIPSQYGLQIAVNIADQNEAYLRIVSGGTPGAWRKLWHAGNDGTGSGLDAGLLEGSAKAAFALLASSPTFTGTVTANAGVFTTGISAVAAALSGGLSAATATLTGSPPLTVSSATMVANLNAELLGGQHAADFAPVGHSHGTSGNVPIGFIGLWATASPPSGFTIYAPTAGRFVVGVNATFTLSATGGASSHGHIAALHQHAGPSHQHRIDHSHGTSTSGGPSATDGIGNGGGTSAPTPGHTHDVTPNAVGATPLSGPEGTGNTGFATDRGVPADAGNSLPPYIGLHYIQRTS